MGLSGGSPADIWGSVTRGLLQGVTSIGINYATQELGIPALWSNIGFSAIASIINAGIQASIGPVDPNTGQRRDVFEVVFDTFKNNALTFLGYGGNPTDPGYAWQQAAYIAQIQDFTEIVMERGLVDALNTYGAGFFNAVAINQIVQSGTTIGKYFDDRLKAGQSTLRTLQDGKEVRQVAIKDAQGNTVANVFFEEKQDGASFYWDLVGKEEFVGDNTYLSWGEAGVDGYANLGYSDAELYSMFDSDIQYQRVIDGQQAYVEIKDLEGNTLLIVEPTEAGSYNVYNSYGEYVDAKISDVLNGKVDYFKDSSLVAENLLNSTGGLDFGLDLTTGNAVISGQSQSLVESIVNGTAPAGMQSFAEKFKYFVGTVGNLMQRPEYSAPQDISALQPYITNNFGSANNDAVNRVLSLMTQQYGFTPDVKVVYGEYVGASGGFGGVSLTAKADASLAFDGNVPSGSKGELTFNLVTGQFESGVITTTDSSGKIKNEVFTSFDLAGVNSGSTFGSLFSFGTGSSYDWNINSGLSANEAWKAESDLSTHTISFSHGLTSGASSSAWNLEIKVNKNDWSAYGTAAIGALAILGGAALAATALGSEGAAVGLAGLTLAGFIAMLKTKQSDA